MRFIYSAFLGAILLSVATAQAPTGDISGTVFDPSGSVVPNATITVTNKDTGLVRTLPAGGKGEYSATSLPAGIYELRAEAPGFRVLLREATVAVGAVTTADLHMQVGGTKDIVTVEAATPQVEYERHTVDGVIGRQQIQNLPLNGRSFLQLAFLEPGVSVAATNQAQYNHAFNVSVLGANPDRTRITVDGSIINDAVSGGAQQNFSQEVVEEFQLSSVNFDLSTGITGAGAVNIVTRSGTNELHGSGFFFWRDHNLSAYPGLARDAFNLDPFFSRRQMGGTAGGPIRRDRLFFFGSIEQNRQRGVFTAFPNSPEFREFGVIAPSPFNGKQVCARIDSRITQNHNFFLRYSHDGNDSFAPRATNSLPSNWVSNVNWADSGVASLISTLRPTLVNEARYSYTFWSNRNSTPTAAQCPNCIGLGLPQIEVLGAGFEIGNTTNAPQTRLVRRHIVADNMTWQHNVHRMKFGGEWERVYGVGTYAYLEPAAMVLFSPVQVRQFNAVAPAGLQVPLPASFHTIRDILSLPLVGFATGVGDVNQPPSYNLAKADHNNRLHAYWEDTWRVRPRFTLNYGLGWSYESNLLNYDLSKPQFLAPVFGANGLKPPAHQPYLFSPALGFAWAVTDDSKTVIRGGAGLYYDSMNLEFRLIERAMLGPRGTGRAQIFGSLVPNPVPGIRGVPPGTPLNFRIPTAFSGGLLVNILPQIRAGIASLLQQNPLNQDLSVRNIEVFKQGTDLFPSDFSTAYAEHFSIGLQRQLTSTLALTADFVFRQFIHEAGSLRDVDLNHFNSIRGPVIPACLSQSQALNPKAQCSTGSIGAIVSGGRQNYKGLLVKLDKRFARRYQFLASYALQSQYGLNGVYDNDNWFASWGPQAPRHLLNISGIVDLPLGFQFSFISSTSSRAPFQPYIPGVDFSGSGIDGFPLPGAKYNRFNFGLGKSDLARMVSAYNQQYAGKTGPNPRQTFPAITLPAHYEFGKSFNSQDIRLTKMFRFGERARWDLFGEAFNVLNIANLGGYSNNLTDPGAFGQPTSRAGQIFGSGGPRAFQLGTRVSF